MTIELLAAPLIEEFTLQLEKKVSSLKAKGIVPNLKVILVGSNPASISYTKNKKKFCEKIGAECEIVSLNESIHEKDFIAKVESIVQNKTVHGVLIQLPLPEQLKNVEIDSLVPVEKDVDGFNFYNLGSLMAARPEGSYHAPCTPKGIITLLKYYKIPLNSKNVLIIGRSLIVGKPLVHMFVNENATVTLAHSKTKDLENLSKSSDIVVCAIGKPKFFNINFFRKDQKQVVIDVGINRDEHGKICGDVDYKSVSPYVAAITPVPGGVGPLTILSLAQNLLQAAENSLNSRVP